MHSVRPIFFGLSIGLMLLAGGLHLTAWAEITKAPFMLVSYGLLFCGCLGAWSCFPDGLRMVWKIVLIVGVSLLVRIGMTGVPVSDDVYRYLWEGKIVAAGESPYRYPADHPGYADYRDAYWEGVNHKDKLTAYPPFAELVFAAISSLFYTPWAFKVFFTIVDLCVIGVLIAMLKQYAMDIRNVLFYALNPLTLFAFAGEAHFDVLLIFAMLLSIWLAEQGRFVWAWFWLGVAIQIKIVAIVLLPLYLWRCQWQKGWIILIPLVIPSLFFVSTLPGFFQGVWHFGGLNTFNGPVHGPIVYMLDGDVFLATLLVIAMLGLLVVWAVWAIRPLTKAAHVSVGALVLLLPVVHYWYILWALPFVVLFPGVSWLVLSLTSGAYFVSVFSVEQGGEWMLPVWAMWFMWLPFLLFFAFELRIVLLRLFRRDSVWKKPETLAVVVPVLNEENRIKSCLIALQAMQSSPNEIIVCDGGSTDRTMSVAETMGAHVIASEPGRGIQIGAGVAQVSSDVVLIVHADCRCDESVSQQIMAVLGKNPDAVGGAVGQRFEASNAKLMIIEMLNDLRAALSGSSFGDQGQFFRVAALEKIGGYPACPLMEDVELSLRMKRAGRVVFIGSGIKNSARQWGRDFSRRVCLILKLVLLFHWNRLLRRDVTRTLYAKYYNR